MQKAREFHRQRKDLEKLSLICWFGFRLKPVLADAVPKMLLTSEVVENAPKIIILLLLQWLSLNPLYTR